MELGLSDSRSGTGSYEAMLLDSLSPGWAIASPDDTAEEDAQAGRVKHSDAKISPSRNDAARDDALMTDEAAIMPEGAPALQVRETSAQICVHLAGSRCRHILRVII